MPVDWSLLKTPDVGKALMDGLEQGQKRRREEDSRNALNALFSGLSPAGQTPGYGDQVERDGRGASVNMAALTPEDMRTAIAVQQSRREQEKASREGDFNRAAFDFSSGSNALLSLGGGKVAPPTPSANALAPAPMKVPGSFAPTLPDQPRQTEPTNPEATNPAFAVLGEPRTGADKPFLKMLQIDPAKAMKFRSDLRDNFVKMVGHEREMYSAAADRLSFATDEVTYQQVIAEFAPRMAALGGDLSQMVPPTYPGPDGIREITMRALEGKDRLSAFLAQTRAKTYADDVDADNERADRNTDSLITDRRNRTRIYGDRAMRGSSVPTGGKPAGGRGRSAAPVKVGTPAEAAKLPKGTRYVTPDGKVMVR